MSKELIHWWAARPQMFADLTVCPVSPEGGISTARPVIAEADWVSAFGVATGITLLLAILLVLGAYETRTMGHQFKARWWKWLVAGAGVTALVCYVYLSLVPVSTAGCSYGEATTRIPSQYALLRASVALVQSLILFVLFSWLLSLVARWTRRATWINNSRFPFRF
ncbi:MAG TPA: hypothetical protein VF647_11805 [Longimicrobium sp.]|jgi:hypothetical protein